MNRRPAPLAAVLAATFLASISSGAFWAGIFFVTARWYGFSPRRNLVLAAVIGGVYALTAWRAGALLRLVERRATPRSVLMITLCVWGAASLMPLVAPARASVLWLVAIIGSVASAGSFPTIESYLTAGRRGADLRGAIGWFNVTWTTATAIPLLVMALLPAGATLWTLALSAVVNLMACLALLAVPAAPGVTVHDAGRQPDASEAEYPHLQRTSAWLLPLSYLICSALAPVLPHRLSNLGVPAAASAVGALWMLTRFATLFLMWKVGFWHGRWGTLVTAGVALVLGLIAVMLGRTLPVVVGGLAILGAGMGLTYYAAIYYTLAVGRGAIDAGGSFEALVGVGYGVGPLVGLVAYARPGATNAASATVIMVLAVSTLALIPLLRPYLRARRGRR